MHYAREDLNSEQLNTFLQSHLQHVRGCHLNSKDKLKEVVTYVRSTVLM